MLKKILTKIIYYLTAALFLLPLVWYRNATFPFISPKLFWLQLFSMLIFVVYLILLFFYWKQYRPRFSWLGLSILLFFVAIFAASIFGVDFHRSFWSRYERMTGLFAMLHYGALFLVWRSALNKEQWSRLWKWFVSLGFVVLLIALYQIVNPNFLFNMGAARVSSTLGNPIFVGGLCLFTFFSSIIFWRGTKSNFKWFWVAGGVLSFVTLFISQTRGDIVGLWFGLMFLGIFSLADGGIRTKYKKFAISGVAILVLAPSTVFVLGAYVPSVSTVPILGRLAATSLNYSTVQTRLNFWGLAVKGWEERKIFGWGWENFFDLDNKYYDPIVFYYARGEEWTDNAHNVILNNLATTGVVGSAAYILMYGLIYVFLFRNYKVKGLDERMMVVLLASFFTAHFVKNLFAFEDLTSYLFLFWLLAGIDIQTKQQITTVAMSSSSIFKNKYLRAAGNAVRIFAIMAVIFAGYMVLYKFTYIPFKADYLEALAIRKAMVDFQGSMDLHRQAIKFDKNPYRSDIAYDFSNFILSWMAAHQDFPFGDYRTLAQQMYVFGVKADQSYLSDFPKDVRAGSLLALAYQNGYTFWQNPGYLTMAEQEYKAMIQYSPHRQSLLYALARVYMSEGKHDEGLRVIQGVIDQAPVIPDSYWMMAMIYYDKKDNENAYKYFKEAFAKGYNADAGQLLFIFDLYKSHKDIVSIEPMIKNTITQTSGANKTLVKAYVDYLNSQKRTSEAAEFSKYLH